MNVWLYRGPSSRNCCEWIGDCCLGTCSCFRGEEFTCDYSEKKISRPSEIYQESSETNGCEVSESCLLGTTGMICLSPLILAAGAIAGVVSGTGLLLKKIGIGCDEESKAYQSALKTYFVYEEVRDNPKRLKLHHDLNKLESLIKSKKETKEEELFKHIPEKVNINDQILELSQEQILSLQKNVLEKHNKSIEELSKERNIFLLENQEELSKLDEDAEKCREIFEKAEKEYFELVESNERKPLINEKGQNSAFIFHLF